MSALASLVLAIYNAAAPCRNVNLIEVMVGGGMICINGVAPLVYGVGAEVQVVQRRRNGEREDMGGCSSNLLGLGVMTYLAAAF
jgi:hypothetical protein